MSKIIRKLLKNYWGARELYTFNEEVKILKINQIKMARYINSISAAFRKILNKNKRFNNRNKELKVLLILII